MARIRTVKPEYWSHPKVTSVCRDARLLFLGLLNEADDEGRMRWSSKRVAGVVFPDDDDVDAAQIDSWCASLEGVGLVVRYEVDGARLLQVVGFTEHQRVSHPTPSRLPSVPESSGNAPEDFANESGGCVSGREGKGKEGKSKPPAYDGEFTTWWQDYPRRVKRAEALKAFCARRREGVDLDLLTRARDHYASARFGQDVTYTMHGASFLAKDGPWSEWLDGPPEGERTSDAEPAW